MRRFFTVESAAVALALVAAGGAIGAWTGLPAWVVALTTALVAAILFWPLALSFQAWVLELYVERGRLDRALTLATLLWSEATTRRGQRRAAIDLGLVRLARGEHEEALRIFEPLSTAPLKPAMRSVVDGSIAYCLAHLDRDLGRAEALVASSSRDHGDPVFDYFLGLIRHKQGRHADAKALIERSLAGDPDRTMPFPAERHYVLGRVLQALGDASASKDALELARGAGGRFGAKAARALNAADEGNRTANG